MQTIYMYKWSHLAFTEVFPPPASEHTYERVILQSTHMVAATPLLLRDPTGMQSYIPSILAALPMPQYTGLILGLRPANERRRYQVTPSLIGWAQA